MEIEPAPDIVSVDDHLIEPPHLWESRLPASLRARGPRAIDTPDGVFWEIDGERFPLSGVAASAGRPLEERNEVSHWDDMRPGCYDPVERVKDMDIDGILASLCFPSIPGFGGTQFNKLADRELGLACIQAYNDFQIEEWAGAAPGRLFAMVLLPYWDPQLAVAEIERTAARGRGRDHVQREPVRGRASRRSTTRTATGIRSSPRRRTRNCRCACTSARRRT